MNLSLKIESGVQNKLKRIKSGLLDMSSPLDDAGEELLDFYGEKTFESQGKAVGARWKSLAASTLLARSRRWGHYAKTPIATGKILIWTGALKSGFKKTVKSTSLVIENLVEYFKYNQGSRKMLALNRTAIDIASKHIISYIRNLIK